MNDDICPCCGAPFDGLEITMSPIGGCPCTPRLIIGDVEMERLIANSKVPRLDRELDRDYPRREFSYRVPLDRFPPIPIKKP